MIAVKIECGCGQRYAFDVEPAGQVLAWPVYCPICGADGTNAANQAIANSLAPQPSAELRFQAGVANSRSTTLTRFTGADIGRAATTTRKGRNVSRKWAARLIGGATVPLLGLVLIAYVQRPTTPRADQGSVSQGAGDDGFPQTLRELNAWYVEPPAGQNAATLYLQAFEALQTGNGSKVPLLGKGILPPPPATVPQAEKSAMASLLKANSQTLIFLARSMNYEESRYPVDLTRGFEAVFPHLPKLRSAALLLELSAVLHAETHQGKEAADDVLAILRLGRSLALEPSLLSQSVRTASISIALASWEQTLNRTDVPKDSLARVFQAFAKLEARETRGEGFDRGLAGERANWTALLKDPHKLMEVLVVPGIKIPDEERDQLFARLQKGAELKTERAQLDRVFDQLMDARKQSFPARLKADAGIQREIAEATASKLTVLEVLLAGFAGQSAREAESLARLRLGMISAALEQFRIEHGIYPNDLSDLIPQYFPGPGLDPFSGAPIRYQKDETGIVLRSVGLQSNESNSGQQPGQREKGIVFTVKRHRT